MVPRSEESKLASWISTNTIPPEAHDPTFCSMLDSESSVTSSSWPLQPPRPPTNKLASQSLDGGTPDRSRNDLEPIASLPPPTAQNHSRETISLVPPPEQLRAPTQTHRRSRTETISPPRRSHQLYSHQTRSSPRISQTSLEEVDLHSTTPEQAPKSKFEEGGKVLANWFHGRSGSVNLGVVRSMTNLGSDPMLSTRETETDNADSASRPMNRLQKRLTPTSPLKQVTSSKGFSFFGSKAQEEQKPDLPEPANDEFLNLDVTASLFPSGSPDPSSLEAFKKLQANAENALLKLQAAYKLRTFSLHETLAENRCQQEELEEANIRVQHVKKQLDGMAEKALEQDNAMRALAEELAAEKQKRRDEEEARKRSIILVKPSDSDQTDDTHANASTPNQHIKRRSVGMLSSDSGFESGDESAAESVFSRKSEGWESPTTTISSRDLSPDITLPVAVPFASPTPPPNKVIKPALLQQRPSAYDRVLKGITSSGIGGSFMGGGARSQKCANCQGATASEAWSVMDILKDENTFLKSRIGELETAVDGCLHLVGG